MKMELDLVRATLTPNPKTPTTPSRRDLQLATDALIAGEPLDLTGVVEQCCSIMLVVARTLAQYEQDPQVPDLVTGSSESIRAARSVMDRGLLLNDWEQVRCGAVMLELSVRGLCAALSVPYDRVLAEVHQAQQAGHPAGVRSILIEAGLVKPDRPEAANDTEVSP